MKHKYRNRDHVCYKVQGGGGVANELAAWDHRVGYVLLMCMYMRIGVFVGGHKDVERRGICYGW